MAEKHILQVSELTKKVKFMLENELNTVWLCGEISNFIAASSGHWYLSLKDAKSQVKCAMFKGNNRRVRISPRNGQQVLVRAKVSLYEPRGDFQLIIELMEDEGEGLLRQQYEQLKQKLNAQGMFGQQFKQPLPQKITSVGIVTSPTGAAVKDILSVLKRRSPTTKVYIYPSLVQGEQSMAEIVSAIDKANNRDECDVLIVGRGGGSLEDLWSFNEERVVEAIFHSRIPVISAVGHEIDTTLSDYVADYRAPTPSAAAEIVSSDSSEQINKLQSLASRIVTNATTKLSAVHQQGNYLRHRLSLAHPEQKIRVHQQRADELHLRMLKTIKTLVNLVRLKPQQLIERLHNQQPISQIRTQRGELADLHQRLTNAINRHVTSKQEKFVAHIEQLHLVSPLATIARGYSVVRNQNEQVISSFEGVDIDESITIQMSDGVISARVTGKQAN